MYCNSKFERKELCSFEGGRKQNPSSCQFHVSKERTRIIRRRKENSCPQCQLMYMCLGAPFVSVASVPALFTTKSPNRTKSAKPKPNRSCERRGPFSAFCPIPIDFQDCFHCRKCGLVWHIIQSRRSSESQCAFAFLFAFFGVMLPNP